MSKLTLSITVENTEKGLEIKHAVNGSNPCAADQESFINLVNGIVSVFGAFFTTGAVTESVAFHAGYQAACIGMGSTNDN